MAELSLCTIPNCYKVGKTRGLCRRHYSRLMRHGDPLGGGTFHGEPMQFIHDALKSDGEDCIIWPYNKTNNGYGHVRVDGKNRIASNYVCKMAHGAKPDDKDDAAHSCGVNDCVNPRHLRWATKPENQADRLIHGTNLRGERSPHAKITEVQALAVMGLKGVKSQRKIAAEFGISNMQVARIHKGESWGWLSDCRSQAVANQRQII